MWPPPSAAVPGATLFLQAVQDIRVGGRASKGLSTVTALEQERFAAGGLRKALGKLAAVRSARYVIAEINEQMPRTHGNALVPFSRVDAFTCTDRPLAVLPPW